MVVVFVLRRTRHRPRLIHEPNYRSLALASGEELLNKARVEGAFITAVPVGLPEKDVRRVTKPLSDLLLESDIGIEAARLLAECILACPAESIQSDVAADASSDIPHALGYMYHHSGRFADLMISFAHDELYKALTSRQAASATTVLFRQDNFFA